MRHFVFVESNTTGTGRLALRRLLDRGDRVTFLTRSLAGYAFPVDSGLTVKVLETNSVDAVARAVREMRWCGEVDALLTFSEFYVSIVAEVASRCGLRGLGVVPARICRDKHATRRALRAAGLPTPEFWRVCSEAEARTVAGRVGYPCIVKPPSDSSSHGVRLVRDAHELVAHFRTLHAWSENVRGQALAGEVLVESLLQGSEYSVETLTLGPGRTEVIGVTDKHLSPPPCFVETGHDFPSAAPGPVWDALAAAAREALAAVGFDFGPAHTEVRWTSDGAVVVEINPRLAGGMIPELVRYALGVDLLAAWFDLLLGLEIDLRPRRRDTASIRFLTAPVCGRFLGVTGVAEAAARACVRDIAITAKPGAKVRPAEDAYDRLGFVIAAGADADAVKHHAEDACSAIVLRIAESAGAVREAWPEDAVTAYGL